jgi:hypoxanthine phosphoribosyltransferase
MTNIEWRTLDDMTALCRANVDRVRALKPDIVVGVPRSGMLPAAQIALALGLPLADLHSFCNGAAWDRRGARLNALQRCRVLLIDDASAFGKTMKASIAAIEAVRRCEILTCTAYATRDSAAKFTIAFEECPKPRLFEWNWWRNGWLKLCCVDIDGVVCVDPTRAQRRDPEQYAKFLSDAAPLFPTAKPVHAFVTGRGEAHRQATGDWLARHGCEYRALKMREDAGPRTAEAHGERKAEFYRKSPAALFIESSDKQAETIARLSGKDALCITTRKVYRA